MESMFDDNGNLTEESKVKMGEAMSDYFKDYTLFEMLEWFSDNMESNK